MKKCFYCDRLFPLFMYAKDKRKYQNASNKGRTYSCRICNYKRWNKDRFAWLWNRSINKYERVEFKTRWQVIKRTLL